MKKIKLFAFIALSSLLAVSCVDDDTNDLGGGNTSIVGFSDDELVASYVAAPGAVNYAIPVNIIGGNQGLYPDADVTVTYELIPSEDADEIAATDDMWDFDGPSGSVTIPAGTNTTTIPLIIHPENLVIGESRYITLRLTTVTSVDDVILATNYDTIKLNLIGLCFSDAGGMYNLVVTQSTGSVYSLPNEEVFVESDGVYLTDSTGPYNKRGLFGTGAQLQSASAGFIFREVCGDIFVDDQGMGNGEYGNLVSQDAAQEANSSIDENGVMTIEYSIWFTSNTVERRYRGVYTPQ